MNRTTLKDLAKEFQVSTTTVSNALNAKPGMGRAVWEKIMRRAREMGYQPNYFAKGLVSTRRGRFKR